MKTPTPQHTPSWIELSEWNGFGKDDPIRVSNERGDFIFISAHERDGEIIAVNVYGGPNGRKTNRSFYPNRVSKPPAKRARKPKVAEENDK